MAKSKTDLILEVVNEIINDGRKKLSANVEAMRDAEEKKILALKPVAAAIKQINGLQAEIEKLQEQANVLSRKRAELRDKLEADHKVTNKTSYSRFRHSYTEGWHVNDMVNVTIDNYEREKEEKLAAISREARLMVASSRAPELAIIAAMAKEAVAEL